MSDSIELVDVIKKLREDIAFAIDDGEQQDIRFNVNSIDVELQTVIKKEANGGIKFEVFNIGANAEGKLNKSTTHKIKLNLTPFNIKEIDPNTGKRRHLKLVDEV